MCPILECSGSWFSLQKGRNRKEVLNHRLYTECESCHDQTLLIQNLLLCSSQVFVSYLTRESIRSQYIFWPSDLLIKIVRLLRDRLSLFSTEDISTFRCKEGHVQNSHRVRIAKFKKQLYLSWGFLILVCLKQSKTAHIQLCSNIVITQTT